MNSHEVYNAARSPQPAARSPRVARALAASLATLLALVAAPLAPAQLLPPTGTIDWVAYHGAWSTPGNWGGTVPASTANVRFAGDFDPLDPEVHIELDALTQARSLWFGAGRWYNLVDDGSGSGSLELGTANGWDTLLAVNADWDSGPQSENNIEVPVTLLKSGHIFNESEGGLRIGGALTLSGANLRIGGYGATHFAGDMTGATHIDVGGSSTDPLNAHDVQPHFVLSGNNSGWSGNLNVYDGAFAIAKGGQSLGTGATNRVHGGGSFAFRNHIAALEDSLLPTSFVYYATGPALRISGSGITRAPEAGAIGALYNDGGASDVFRPVQLVGFATMGARGDRKGVLGLLGPISGGAASSWLIKVGPGLIVFAVDNTYLSNTIIRDGVLRIGQANTLPTNSRLVFQDSGTIHGPYGEPWTLGGILELMPQSGDFTRTIGIGAGQVNWEGSGGFSAFGGNMKVILSGGAQLTWDADGFVPDGKALLLSSRYADSTISFTNDINLGSGQREIRVERGVGDAHAVLTGALSGSGGLTKTGRGMLMLESDAANYSGATRIEGGALFLPGNYSYQHPPLPNSNIQFDGGVLGLRSRNVYLNIGSGAEKMQWLGHGGFAAYYGDVNLWLELPLNWGTGGDIDGAYELRFGHYTADRTLLWKNSINIIGGGTRTIRLERGSDLSRADVAFSYSSNIFGPGTLKIVGDGRMDYEGGSWIDHPDYVRIHGAELRINMMGNLVTTLGFALSHGGTLTLDNWGTYDPDSNYGMMDADRIDDNTPITFNAGNLNFWRTTGYYGNDEYEKVGDLIFESGRNTIGLGNSSITGLNQLDAISIQRDTASRSTLYLSAVTTGPGGGAALAPDPVGNSDPLILPRLRLDTTAGAFGINDATGDKIIPWAVVGSSWAQPTNDSATSEHVLEALPNANYYLNQANTWNSSAVSIGRNALLKSNGVVGTPAKINSLIISSSDFSATTLSLNNILDISSGGLMTIGHRLAIINGFGAIRTSSGRPLYIHTLTGLTIGGTVNFFGGLDLVKSGPGSHALTLASGADHQIGNLYIHSGTVDLQRGAIYTSRIYVGDGAGTDIFKLPGNRREALRGIGGARGGASITLHGTPYDPRGPDYGGDQAILMMGGNTKQSLANLHIEERGTIDWVGGEVGKANILWLDTLTFSGTDAILYMRNWYEYEDMLLVKAGGFDLSLLNNVVFEGYENYTTKWRAYDGIYWQVTPFWKDANMLNEPEPETYGALLAALGTGLVLWRKRRQRRSRQAPSRHRAARQ